MPAVDNASILNTLDGSKKSSTKTPQQKKSHLKRNILIVSLLLLAGTGFAFYADKSETSHSKPLQSESISKTTDHIKIDSEKVSTSLPQIEPQAAVIESDANDNVSQDMQKDPKTKLTESLEAGLPVSGTSLKTALESPKKNSEKPTKSVNAERVPDKKTNTPSTKRQDDVKASDRDVNILTALVGDEKAAAETKNAQNAKSKSTSKQNTKQTKAAKHEEDGPDIVERKPGDSTSGLLARCKKLGFVEGELCRWRICGGRWDTDAACKAQPVSQ